MCTCCFLQSDPIYSELVSWFNGVSTEAYNATVVMLSIAEIQNWIRSFIIYEPVVDSPAAHKLRWLSWAEMMIKWILKHSGDKYMYI